MFNEILKSLRKQKGLTQDEVAKLLKINRGTYANYERGHRQPDYDTLLLIADFYDVDLNYLLGRDFKQVTDKPLTDRQKYLMDWFMQKEHLFFQDGGSIEDAIDDLEIMFEAHQKMRKRFEEDQKKKN